MSILLLLLGFLDLVIVALGKFDFGVIRLFSLSHFKVSTSRSIFGIFLHPGIHHSEHKRSESVGVWLCEIVVRSVASTA